MENAMRNVNNRPKTKCFFLLNRLYGAGVSKRVVTGAYTAGGDGVSEHPSQLRSNLVSHSIYC